MSPAWLAASLPVLAASLALLFFSIRALLRALRANRLYALPLAEEHEIDLPSPGTYVLHAVGPRFSLTFMGLDYELRRVDDDSQVPLGRAWLAMRTNGVSRARVPLRRFAIDRPGRFRLIVRHLTPDRDRAGRELLVTRADAARMILRVLGIVAGGYFAIGSLIVTVLALVGPADA